MLILLAIPVIVAVACGHRLSQAVAPSNILIRHVRGTRPRVRRAIGLAALSLALIALAHALERMIEAGAADWLNLIVVVLLWDAIKMGFLAVSDCLRSLARSAQVRVLAR